MKLLVMLVFMLVTLADSAAASPLPPSSDASRIPENFKLQPGPKAIGGYDLPRMPLQGIPDGAAGVSFKLTGVTIKGGTVYRPEEFAPFYRDKIGQDVSLAYLFQLANAITTKYRNDGYILAKAILPAQEIATGNVTIQIIEGYVSEVVIRGDEPRTRGKIKMYADKIPAERPLNIATLERYLLLIRDVPGFRVESLLQPADDGAGSAQLILDITYDPASFSFGIDNYGTKYLGPIQTTTRIQTNSMFRPGDGTTMRYIGTDAAIPLNRLDLKYFDFSHTELVGSEGTTFTVTGGHAIAYPNSSLKELDAKTQSTTMTAEINHPIIRSRRMNLSTGLQFSFLGSKTFLLGAKIANDNIRALRAKIGLDFIDRFGGMMQTNLEFAQGLKWLGSSSEDSEYLSRLNAKPDFTKANFDIARVQSLGGNFNLYTAAAFQYSNDSLLAAEEFGIGGSLYGRGYDPSEITGDSGMAAKIELQYFRSPQSPLLRDYQLFAFYDIGKVYQNGETVNTEDSLASAGAGVRFNVNERASGTLLFTQPLTRPVAAKEPNHEHDPRAFFSILFRF